MSCPVINLIDQDEYIGDSLPKINTNFTSLSTTLCEVINDRSITANGYQKLLGNLIIQWGQAVTAAGGSVTVTFPKTFPNNCFCVVATDRAAGVAGSDIIGISTTTNATFLAFASTNSGAAVSTTFNWIALGN